MLTALSPCRRARRHNLNTYTRSHIRECSRCKSHKRRVSYARVFGRQRGRRRLHTKPPQSLRKVLKVPPPQPPPSSTDTTPKTTRNQHGHKDIRPIEYHLSAAPPPSSSAPPDVNTMTVRPSRWRCLHLHRRRPSPVRPLAAACSPARIVAGALLGLLVCAELGLVWRTAALALAARSRDDRPGRGIVYTRIYAGMVNRDNMTAGKLGRPRTGIIVKSIVCGKWVCACVCMLCTRHFLFTGL